MTTTPEIRAEERASAAEAMNRINPTASCFKVGCQARVLLAEILAAEAKLDRLRNPDEAMCTVFNEAWGFPGQDHTAQGIRAISAHLDEKEKDDGNEK